MLQERKFAPAGRAGRRLLARLRVEPGDVKGWSNESHTFIGFHARPTLSGIYASGGWWFPARLTQWVNHRSVSICNLDRSLTPSSSSAALR